MSSTASQNHLGLRRALFKMMSASAILGMLAIVGCGGNNGSGSETLDIGLVEDAGSHLAAIVTSQGGDEALLILGSKRSDGSLRELSGGGFIDLNGRSMFFWFGADGLPTRAVFDDLTVFFESYTTSSVDLAAVHPNGTVTRASGVSLDADLLSDLRSLAAQGATFKGLGPKSTPAETAKLTDQQWSSILKWTTFGAQVVCCATSGSLSLLGVAPVVPVVAVCCGGALLTIVTDTVFTPQPMDTVEFYNQHPEYLEPQIKASVVEAGSTAEEAEPFAQADCDGDSELTIEIKALIDGEDFLVIKCNTIRWHHTRSAAVGRHLGANEPTLISTASDGVGMMDRVPWVPEWPEPVPAEIRYDAWSSTYNGLTPGLPAQDMSVTLTTLSARDTLEIVQYPSSANEYTLIIEFDDGPHATAWYRARLDIQVE
ncbi:MAG: hypothetical protein IID41_18315 [Planctomycetes bacterium]|nr:hypothetical protein [Planctomycetota bacterium]